MSLKKCINNAEKAGELTAEQATEIRRLLQQEMDAPSIFGGNPEHVDDLAAKRAFQKWREDIKHKQKTRMLNIRAFNERFKEMQSYKEGEKGMRWGRALASLVSSEARSRGVSLESYEDGVVQSFFARMSDVLYENRRTISGGARNPALMRNIVRELFGGDTKDAAAKALAKSWSEAAEFARLRANNAGMRIAKNADWGLSQLHNDVAMREVSSDEWVAFVMPLLDRNKMLDAATMQSFTDDELKKVLANTYQSITTQGLHKQDIGTTVRGSSLANRRMEHRFLAFENGDKWLEYQQRFGSPDTFDNMVTHIRSMAKDVAQLEMFGPDPELTWRRLQTHAKKLAYDSRNRNWNWSKSKFDGDSRQAQRLWEMQTRGVGISNQVMAHIGSGIRNVLSSAMLGGAPISAASDMHTLGIAAELAGMPVNRVLQRYLKEMAQSPESAKFAARMGIAAQAWIDVGTANMRYFGETNLPGFTRRLADATHRASGLTGMTRAAQQAFGIELQGHLADQVGKSFDELDGGLREVFQRNGISADDWELLRQTKLHKQGAATYLRILDVGDRQDLDLSIRTDLSARAFAMLQREIVQAVPQATIRSRDVFGAGSLDLGTWAGEGAAAVAMFKSFPIALFQNNIARMADRPFEEAWWPITRFFVISAFMGALILQTKQMTYGRDPRPMNSGEFWLAAILQGGGLGIYGDFFFANRNRYGHGLGTTLAGPVASMLTNATDLTLGNVMQLMAGEETHAGRELVSFLQRYTPGSSMWYGRLAFDRLLIDNMLRAVDPEAPRRFRQQSARLEKNMGQGTWWTPGELGPNRPPNLSNIFGDN